MGAQSYRSKSSQCSPLPQQTQLKIQEEEQKCAKYETKKTHVSSIYSSGQKDSYSIKKHSYIYKEDKICISQEPVVQCSSGSIPQRAASASSPPSVSSVASLPRSSNTSRLLSRPRWMCPSSAGPNSSKLKYML